MEGWRGWQGGGGNRFGDLKDQSVLEWEEWGKGAF